jgi:hypothetical protein
MPNVLVVPVYVEVLDVERAIMTLESHLRRAGYAFHTGEPLRETLDETTRRMSSTQARNSHYGSIGT